MERGEEEEKEEEEEEEEREREREREREMMHAGRRGDEVRGEVRGGEG